MRNKKSMDFASSDTKKSRQTIMLSTGFFVSIYNSSISIFVKWHYQLYLNSLGIISAEQQVKIGY